MTSSRKILFVLLLAGKLLAQNEFQNWHFGSYAGLNFGTNPPSVISNTLNSGEGYASISDAMGNLLFYTEGVNVINGSNALMANGSGINGGLSSTQAAMIVKQPSSSSIYYIFTLPGVNLHTYSIVDMSLAAGQGSVTTKNAVLINEGTERQVAVKHCNGKDIWILNRAFNSNSFNAFLLTSAGINTVPVVSNIGDSQTGNPYTTAGHLKISADGRKLAMATASNSSPATISQGGFYMFDFDPATGVVSNSVVVKSPALGAYGVEFSPDGSKLYGITSPASSSVQAILYQWDICSGNQNSIASSEYSLSFGTFTSGAMGSIQRGPYDKLYITQNPATNLHVVASPNSSGIAMGLQLNAINVSPGTCRLGLPNFINKGRIAPTTFVQNIACQSGTFSVPAYTALSVCSYTANPYTAYKWDFGDNASAQNTATTATANHFFTALGTYSVKLIMYANCTNDTITQVVNVAATSPTVNVAGTFTVCKGDNRIYTASGGSSYQWSGNAVTNASISLSPTATTAYTATAVQGSCATSQAFTVTVNKCTGVSEQEESLQVQLFPNPAKEHISLQLQSAANLRVLALDGKLVKQQALQTGTSDVDVTQLPVGMYIFEISDGTQMYRERVVIGN